MKKTICLLLALLLGGLLALPVTAAPEITMQTTEAPVQTISQASEQDGEDDLSWWVFVLIGAVCGGGGTVAAFVLVKKSKH